MRLLLVNTNPAVSRLITLSAKKLEYELIEVSSFDELETSEFDIAFIDSDCYDEDEIDKYKSKQLARHYVYVGPRKGDKPSNMDSMLEKPFLPTDFINMVESIERTLDEFDDEATFETLEELEDEKISDETFEDKEDEEDKTKSKEMIDLDSAPLPYEESEKDADPYEPLISFGDQEDEDEKEEDYPALEEPKESDSELDFQETQEESSWSGGGVLDEEEVKEVQELLAEDLEDSDDVNENAKEEDGLEDLNSILSEIEDLDVDSNSFVEEEPALEEEPAHAILEAPSSDPFAGLSEEDLKIALGEAVEEVKTTVSKDTTELKNEIKNELSKALENALSQTKIKEALKNMKINISVSFEEE